MNARFDDWEGEHLAHYGTKGMKWGQRRFQNSDGSLTELGKARYGRPDGYVSTRKASRDLNKLDKESLEARYRARQIGKIDKIDKYKQKSAKATKAGRKDKAAKYNEKVAKLNDRLKNLSPKQKKKMEDYYKLSNKSKAMTAKILKQLKKNGYDVKSKDIYRNVYSNRDHALNALGALGAAGMALGTAAVGPTYSVSRQVTPNLIRTTQYKVGIGVAPSFGGVAKGKHYKVKKKKS